MMINQGGIIMAIKNEYLEQDMPSVDSEIVKNMSIYGKAYELIYADEKSKPRSVRLDPEHTFVCYSQSAFEKPLFAVYYYKKYDLDGYCTGSLYIHTQVLTAIRHCHCKMLNHITFLMYLLSNTEIIRKCRAILNSL